LDEALHLLDQCMRQYQLAADLQGELRALAALIPIYGDRGKSDAGVTRAQTLLRAVEPRAGTELSGALATVYLGLASLYFDCGRHEDQPTAAKRAGELARTAGDERLLVRALHWQDLAAFNLRRDAEMVDKLALIAQAERIGETWIAAWSLAHVAMRHSLSGEIAQGRPYAARGLELANQRQDPTLIAGMWVATGRLSYHPGEWARA
jgi:hypothetical protein